MALGLEHVQFRSHSLRRGGATQLALDNWSFTDIMAAGRWASERSCRLYVMKGEVMVLSLRRSLAQEKWGRIVRLAETAPFFLDRSFDLDS